ncbi:NAD-dependent DNA ligase [Marinobacter salarius]|uniref:BRCT domain-containing protein n=1 Tax=Marinobacter salarius TaxID=1420917 RepID=UPI0012597360|nr:BRCT domain-containing protein [Marinobacter salarius]VVT02949.1 NAD-dependent DNA ligase [Marinobacter salarius]VXC24507.1 NAD-dependent DNA ligase [Marinobacter salarius]
MMKDHNEALAKRFGGERLEDRKVDQLLGLCEGVIADGQVNQQEAEFIQNWLRLNSEVQDRWPASVIFSRLNEFLQDGVLDDNEEGQLVALLMEVAGMHGDEGKIPSSLPLCAPQPQVEFPGKRFVLTGKFASGTRNECKKAVQAVGGSISDHVSSNVDYLVIGTLVSDSWIHESYGRKIEKAVEVRDSGSGLAIVSEETWAGCIAALT